MDEAIPEGQSASVTLAAECLRPRRPNVDSGDSAHEPPMKLMSPSGGSKPKNAKRRRKKSRVELLNDDDLELAMALSLSIIPEGSSAQEFVSRGEMQPVLFPAAAGSIPTTIISDLA